MKTYGIILASGSGSRFGADIPKQFIKIKNKTILEYSLKAFENSPCIDEIVLVITPEYRGLAEKIVAENKYEKVSKIIDGGKERKDSSFNGVSVIDDTEAKVLIHDCARPFVSQKIISDCVNALDKFDAVCTAIISTDTVFEMQDGVIKNIPERSSMMRAQTPQGFKLSVIKRAHVLAKNDKNFTDDCGLVIRYNLCDVGIIEGSETNLKITYPDDLYFADRILGQ